MAAKSALFNGLTTAFAAMQGASEQPVLVVRADPGPYDPDDIVSVGDVVNRTLTQHAFVGDGGQHAGRETYEVEVVVDCFRMGDVAQLVDERAWTLEAAVETYVRGNRTLGGVVEDAWPTVSRTESMWDDKHKGHRVRLTVGVECVAEL